MGSSCSSLKKKDRERSSSVDTGPPVEGPADGQRKGSGRSAESLPYGIKADPSPSATTKSSRHLRPDTSLVKPNGETKSKDGSSPTPVNQGRSDIHLAVGPSASSPLPSSQTPSPYTTPCINKPQSSAHSGLPDLSLHPPQVRCLLTGSRPDEVIQFPPVKELAIYVCADYIDTERERCALMEKVFPGIKTLCAEKGYDARVVDMHWGVSSDCLNDHCFAKLCINTLKKLREKGRLLVLILVNESPEPPLLPAEVNEDDFGKIISCIKSEDVKELYHKWYLRDENSVPTCYVLQPKSEYLTFIDSDSQEKRQETMGEWVRESGIMIAALKSDLEDEESKVKFIAPVIEEEIREVLFGQPSLFKRTLYVQRRFTETPANLAYSFDESQQCRLDELKRVLDQQVPEPQKIVIPVKWFKNATIDDHVCEDHALYLEQLCEGVTREMRKLVEGLIEEAAQSESLQPYPGITSNLHLELIQQNIARQGFVSDFVGRDVYLNQVAAYITSPSNHPLVISGPLGSGKSALLAKCSYEACSWLANCVVVYRTVGVSEESLSHEQLLRNICEQFCALYGEHVSVASQVLRDPKASLNKLNKLLGKVSAERPLVVMIDGLDQVEKYSNSRINWLPTELAPNVKLVLTCRDESKLCQELKKSLTESASWLPLGSLNKEEYVDIVDNILTRNKRSLTDAQRRFVFFSLHDFPTPLNAHLLGNLSTQWHSIRSPDELSVKGNVETKVVHILEATASYVGAPVLASVLALFVVAKHGLSDSEILDLLSCDENVLDRVYSHNSPSIRTFPYSIWVRIKSNLKLLLRYKVAGDRFVIAWKSDFYKKCAVEYMKDSELKLAMASKALVDYFKGDSTSTNFILPQPPMYGPCINKRKVEELPFLELQSRAESRDEYLFDLQWLAFKMKGSDPLHFVEDIEVYMSRFEDDQEQLHLLAQVIRASGYPLRYDGSQLCCQLFGRLQLLVNDQKSAQTYPKLKNLYQMSATPSLPSLMPLNTQLFTSFDVNHKLLQPSKQQEQGKEDFYENIFTIKGDENNVVAISSTSGEISVWDIFQGKRMRTLKGITQPRDVKMIDRYKALVLCNRELRLYNLDEGVLETKLKGVMNQKMPFYGLHDENYVVALSRNRMYVNMLNLKTGDLETTFKVGEDRFLNSLLVSANGKICVCGDETQKPFPLLVWDLSNRKLLYDLRIPHHEFLTQLSAISDDGHFVVCVCNELNTSSVNFIIVYDLQSGTLFKKWKPDSSSHSIAISSQSGCVAHGMDNSHILVWDLSTGAKRHTFRGHSAPVDVLRIAESGKRFLSYDSRGRDRSLRVWDLSSGACLAVFTPDAPLSCCQLSLSGKLVIFGLVNSLQLHTLVLCHETCISDEKATQEEAYGDPVRHGMELEMIRD